MTVSPRLTIALLFSAAAAGASATAGPDQNVEAAMLWNQAVAAKGGRAKLEAVRNLVVTERTIYAPGNRLDPGFTRQRLYVFPARLWVFFDHQPGTLGNGFQVFDLEQPVGWNDVGRLPDRKTLVDDATYDLLEGQFLYLLETAFMKPVPTGTRSGRVGRVAVDVVEVTVPQTGPLGYHSDIRVEYYLDRQSRLPVRAVVFRTVRAPTDKPGLDFTRETRYTLGDYADIGGLQMPRIAMVEGPNTKNTTSYWINVEYDQRVFTLPVSFPRPELAVLDGWGKK
ncbi:MAG: hypothetical protein A3G76_03940 [Acidobacteria bacterium RIFCSPLOWO2_12_FULL_65_11]|nr:MAG: hypothetical protein A3H95_01685 [Acidobacteria bacterium RIFCSPLOWO2_02_FULL_64_15]OFW33610.1 MAG: hypothetical protein A3G76_03940 [Acidobacteria bacterium RIFCSPLOWO2_12_FULL_65_11]